MGDKTKGEFRVRTEFNPSEDGTVDQIKQKSAELINTCEGLKEGFQDEEKERLIAIAQEKYEEAAMWAVKAATSHL